MSLTSTAIKDGEHIPVCFGGDDQKRGTADTSAIIGGLFCRKSREIGSSARSLATA